MNKLEIYKARLAEFHKKGLSKTLDEATPEQKKDVADLLFDSVSYEIRDYIDLELRFTHGVPKSHLKGLYEKLEKIREGKPQNFLDFELWGDMPESHLKYLDLLGHYALEFRKLSL